MTKKGTYSPIILTDIPSLFIQDFVNLKTNTLIWFSQPEAVLLSIFSKYRRLFETRLKTFLDKNPVRTGIS